MNKVPLYSSLFYVLGLCYEWNTVKIASLYGTAPQMVNLWLEDIGLSDYSIKEIENREPFSEGFCKFCGIKSEHEFCRDECKDGYAKNQSKIEHIVSTGLIPVVVYKNVFYNTKTNKIIRMKNLNESGNRKSAQWA